MKNNQKQPKQSIFVVQKHNASHLHYDFRLEKEGVLKSWAIPKEPPEVSGVRRLAIEVEDHDLDYADFEGEIPEGHYGAGTVEIWDKGTYDLIKVEEKEIVFDLHGKRLTGQYCLVRFTPKDGKGNTWLFFKKSH
ncbi:MAG: DNA polymerase ligase N-terminal domain-containing protein [Candidatus Omnitrophota bacterium]